MHAEAMRGYQIEIEVAPAAGARGAVCWGGHIITAARCARLARRGLAR
jgi:hypothetical protein